MANITRYDPFEEVFGDVFPGFFRPMATQRRAALQARLDVHETENEYLVSVEIPGARKEDIDVKIFGNQVTVDAEVKEEKPADGQAKTLLSERTFGKVSRSITLPMDIDEAGGQAKHVDGVLHLTLPKKATSMAKKLTVQ